MKTTIALALLAFGTSCFAQSSAPPLDPGLRQNTYRTASGGTLTVTSGQPPAGPVIPKPSFAALDRNNDGSIDETEAAAYITLANDFIYADHNRDGRISAREFNRW